MHTLTHRACTPHTMPLCMLQVLFAAAAWTALRLLGPPTPGHMNAVTCIPTMGERSALRRAPSWGTSLSASLLPRGARCAGLLPQMPGPQTHATWDGGGGLTHAHPCCLQVQELAIDDRVMSPFTA